MTINLPSSSLNMQENFFKEETIPQKFQVKKNPQNIPLINGSNIFVDKEGITREMDSESRAYLFWDKILVEHDGSVFQNIDGSDRFEDITNRWSKKYKQGEKKYRNFNYKMFEKNGDSIVSRYIEDWGWTFEFLINGKEYTLPVGWNIDIWHEDCWVNIVGEKIYVVASNRIRVYNASQQNLVLLSDEYIGEAWNIRVLPTWDIIKTIPKKEGSKNKEQIIVNNKNWTNEIDDDNTKMQNSTNHLWVWNKNEIIIDDKKYNLGGRVWKISDHCQISENGNIVAIDFNYDETGVFDQHKEVKKWKYILLWDKNGIQKEIKLGEEWIQKIVVDDEWQLAYITKQRTGGKMLLNINEFHYELDLKDDYNTLKEFSFIGKNIVNIKYINNQNEIVQKHISLNEDAEQVKQKLEAEEREAKNALEIKKWLTDNNITSIAQLMRILDDAKKVEWLNDAINLMAQDLQKVKLENTSLQKENTTLTQEKDELTAKNAKLQADMTTVIWWVKKVTWNYDVTPEAKTILGLK